jgi:uroporphyrinogen-III decarboxylase
MTSTLNIDHNEIERRKDLYRRTFDYQPVDHLPVFVWVQGSTSADHTIRWELENGENQLAANLAWIERSLRLLPDDYIPVVRITQGYLTVATMFGCQAHWSEDPNQPPGVMEHPIKDLSQVYSLPHPDLDSGWMPENLHRMRLFAESLPPDVSLTGVDIGGPLNNMKDLIDTNLFYTAFYDDPKAVHYLLDLLSSVQLEVMQSLVAAAGGDLRRFGSLDFDPVWHPEKYISFCSDDVSATLGPKTFEEFSLPYNDRLYAPWGSGGFHNCGPHPCKSMYTRHQQPVKYLNCSHHYSRKDFPALREIFAGWGVIEPMFDLGERAEEMLAGFRLMMENLAPDVLTVPICIVDNTWRDDDVTDLYHEMRKISEEYARNMRWAG